jgi:WD40 repeat protein
VVVFSRDGKALASGGVCRGEMKLFAVAGGKVKATLVTWKGYNPEGVLAIAFTPDGKTLVSVGRPDEIKLWEVATGKNRGTRTTADEFHHAALSPDGKAVATTSYDDSRITLCEVATGKERGTLKGHAAQVYSLAFSPDGKTLACGYADGTIELWDVTGGKELAALKGHVGEVSCLAFSANGKLLASGGADKTIQLWSTAGLK